MWTLHISTVLASRTGRWQWQPVRDNQMDAFHAKVIEGINKQQYMVINYDVAKELEGLPQSWQLINYVIKDTSATTKIRVVSNSSIRYCMSRWFL